MLVIVDVFSPFASSSSLCLVICSSHDCPQESFNLPSVGSRLLKSASAIKLQNSKLRDYSHHDLPLDPEAVHMRNADRQLGKREESWRCYLEPLGQNEVSGLAGTCARGLEEVEEVEYLA